MLTSSIFSVNYRPYLAWSYLSVQTFPSNPDLQPYGFKNVENYHIDVHCYPTHTFATIALWQNYQNYNPYTPCIHIEQYCQVQVITRSKVSHSKSCISTIYVYFFWFSGTIWSKNWRLIYPLLNPFWTSYIGTTPYIFFYKMLAIRLMTCTYFNVISTLLIYEFCMFYLLKKCFFPYVDL